MKFLNYTPHQIKLNSGETFESQGVARVSSKFTDPNEHGICEVVYGEVEGLPEPQEGVMYIVSAMVIGVCSNQYYSYYRTDVVAPATGHPETVRNDKGHIVSVPCFVR